MVKKFDKGKVKHIPVPYVTKEAREYQRYFASVAKKQIKRQKWDKEITRGKHFYFDCVFYFPRIDMDDQNYWKVMVDALKNIAFIDDNYILVRDHRIYYDKKNPRVEIHIHPVDYVGVFDDKNDFNEFLDKCKTCTRFKNSRCSILKDSMNYRIREEIEDGVCTKYKEKKK